jgi:hypothetical protein
MRFVPRTTVMAVSVAVVLFAALGAVRPVTAAAPAPSVLHVGQIDRQDVAPQPGSEPDTLVEPDVAASPANPDIAVAVAHDGRFPTGGAVAIAYAWTRDGGAHWHHAPIPGLTKATGGVWDRASDPIVAFDRGGNVFISTLVFDNGCQSGVAVSRSTDGGATFAAPVLVHRSLSCDYSDDKNFMVIDTQPASQHLGRIYQFWTAFLTINGNAAGSPQVLRWSDNRGATWSPTTVVSGAHENTQDSQAMIHADGTVTDTYQGSGTAFVARSSLDGGATWSSEAVVTNSYGGGPAGIRCCLPAGAADTITGKMYVVWEANGPGNSDAVELSTSVDGRHWSAAKQVGPGGAGTSLQTVNATVTAYNGRVFVSYGIRDLSVARGRYIQQEVSTSYDAGATFGPALLLGPLSDLHYAAFAGGKFPGDYIGASATQTKVYLVWCVSSTPPVATQKFHQTLFAAVLRP